MTDEKIQVQDETEVLEAEVLEAEVLETEVLEGELVDEFLGEGADKASTDGAGKEVLDNEVSGNENKVYKELLDKYQRSLAEFDNFRKRTLKEKSQAYDNGVHNAVEKLLPTLDNFERALSVKEDKEDTFYQGIVMIARQLDTYLQELGVEAIPGSGTVFDHNLHFAVAHVEDPEYGASEIIEELQKGYTYKGKVIRPSMVKVAN